MKVLMFGWEFPPMSSGGLGTACAGLTKELVKKGADICFVVPSGKSFSKPNFKLMIANKFKMLRIRSLITPYMSSVEYQEKLKSKGSEMYGSNLFEEIYKYTVRSGKIARSEQYDVIHCHDWMTYQAGINAKRVSGKPLIVHVHATEFDRTAGSPNMAVYDLEKKGMEQADLILTVSNYTKNKIVQHYSINPDKVKVVYNGVELEEVNLPNISKTDKIVLFLGRITIQKGPEYFLYAAKKILGMRKDVKFIMAGNGDMAGMIIEKAAEMGIADKLLFTGFLKGADIDRAYKMADVYVMPSVSEPFGITPLEAMKNNTPVIISKQSGVSELVKHCLKVDFWDVDELANKINAVLDYRELHDCLAENGYSEAKSISWEQPAQKCYDAYQMVTAR